MLVILKALLEFVFNGMDNVLYSAVNIVSQSPNQFNSQVASTMEAIHSVVLPVGATLLVVFFLIDLSNKATMFENMTLQMFVGMFIKLIMCSIIMQHSFVILNGIFDVASNLNGKVGEIAITESMIDLEGAKESLGNSGFLERFMIFAILLVMCVFAFIAQVMVIGITYGRMIELYLFTALAPIPISFMSSSEHHNVGKNYILHYAGVCLQGTVIIVIISIYNSLSSSMIMQPGDSFMGIASALLMNIMIAFVLVGVLWKSGTWSQKLVRAV